MLYGRMQAFSHAGNVCGRFQGTPFAAEFNLELGHDYGRGDRRPSGRGGGAHPFPQGPQRNCSPTSAATSTSSAIAEAYNDFRGLNADFEAVVSDWQLKDGEHNNHENTGYDAGALTRLGRVHESVLPITGAVAAAQLPRLRAYADKHYARATAGRRPRRRRLTPLLPDMYQRGELLAAFAQERPLLLGASSIGNRVAVAGGIPSSVASSAESGSARLGPD
jgi:hypothetical protein